MVLVRVNKIYPKQFVVNTHSVVREFSVQDFEVNYVERTLSFIRTGEVWRRYKLQKGEEVTVQTLWGTEGQVEFEIIVNVLEGSSLLVPFEG